MFERQAHRNVLALLQALDAGVLSPVRVPLRRRHEDRAAAGRVARDLIDLSDLRARTGPVPETAWRKVDAAYMSAARTDLEKALTALLSDTEYQKRCFQGMGIEDPGRLLEGMRLLRDDLSRTP